MNVMIKNFAEIPEKEYRPGVRWWLAEGFHTDETLRKEMQQLDDMGMGSIEFLAMDEHGIDETVYGWGSEEWVHDSHLLVEEAANRGMGVSMTSGTNWACANLVNITPDDPVASKELDFVEETLEPGQRRNGPLPKCEFRRKNINVQELVAVVAARYMGENETDQDIMARPRLAKETLVLTDLVQDDCLDWTAPEDGTYKLFFFWLHGTGQVANPAYKVCYAVNYMDKCGMEAVINYWNKVVLTPEMRKNLLACGRAMLYMDSIELFTYGAGGQLWGYCACEEFKRRRGYDVTPYLPFVIRRYPTKAPNLDYYYSMEDSAFLEKFRNDLWQTLTELYMEHALKPIQEWTHTVGMELRAEISYGQPFEISMPGKYVDGIETESLEFGSQIDGYRTMSGAAHIYNRTFSSETGASLSNYMMPLDFYNQIAFTQFAAGVSRTVFHGYASICGSETATEWPGHEGMWPKFAERFGPRQPAFKHYPEWTAMLARFQKMLRVGKPRMDLGILRLDYFVNNLHMDLSSPKEEWQYGEQGMRADQAFYWKDMGLQHAGYTWDYFAPQLLEEEFAKVQNGELYPDGPGYKALVIYQELMPLGAARKLLQLAQDGLPIVFVNGVTEEIRNNLNVTHKKAASRTPFVMEADQELEEVIKQIKALPNVRETDVQAETLACLQDMNVVPRAAFAKNNSNVLTCMRQTEQGMHLFVYHMKYAKKESTTVTLHIAGGGRPYMADCWTGDVKEISGALVDGATVVTLTLQPGEATMLVLDHSEAPRELSCGRYDVTEIPLPKWHLVVEDWNEGEKHTITEERTPGVVTTEVWYDTKKILLDAGEVPTIPWKDIPAVGPAVSGVGTYTVTVEMPADWCEDMGAELVLGSTNGSTAAVYVNGQKAPVYNINSRTVEIGHLLQPGLNEIKVEVSSTLNNRLLERGYYATARAKSNVFLLKDGNAAPSAYITTPIETRVRDYGLTGETVLRTYRKEM